MRFSEEPNTKENLYQEESTSARREARACQTPEATIERGFCHTRH